MTHDTVHTKHFNTWCDSSHACLLYRTTPTAGVQNNSAQFSRCIGQVDQDRSKHDNNTHLHNRSRNIQIKACISKYYYENASPNTQMHRSRKCNSKHCLNNSAKFPTRAGSTKLGTVPIARTDQWIHIKECNSKHCPYCTDQGIQIKCCDQGIQIKECISNTTLECISNTTQFL